MSLCVCMYMYYKDYMNTHRERHVSGITDPFLQVCFYFCGFVCMCVCVHLSVIVYMCAHTNKYAYPYTCLIVHMCAHSQISMNIVMCVCIYVIIDHINTRREHDMSGVTDPFLQVCVHLCALVCMCKCTCICDLIYMRTHK